MGPGSLYTSIIPNLLVEGLAKARSYSGGEERDHEPHDLSRGDSVFIARVIRAPLLAVVELEEKPTVKHDPERLGRLLASEARSFKHSWTHWFSP